MDSISHGLFLSDIFEDLRHPQLRPRIYDELERSLLQFSRPKLVWTIRGSVRLGRDSFWARELVRQFPGLSQRGAVTLNTTPGDS